MNAPVLAMPSFLDRKPLVWTYTMLNTYRDICGHQTFRRYIRKDIPYAETPQMRWGNEVHSAMELRMGGKPLPDSMSQWEPIARQYDGYKVKAEAKLAVDAGWKPTDYFSPTVRGRGRADAVIADETSAYFADWKTGKVREDPFELQVQAVLLHAKYPGLKIIKGQYVWLKENRVGELYDLSDTARTRVEIERIVCMIEQDRRNDSFEKKQGPLCGWCDVGDCEHNRKSK